MNWIPTLIIALDQITKRIATYYFERNIFFSYFGFSNVLTCNKGVSFSCFEQSKYCFLLKYVIILFLLIIIYLLYTTKNKLEKLALNLMLGGGISNTIDRFFFNGVIDFIHFNPIILSPIIFNVADLMISIGTFLLVISSLINSLLEYKKEQNNDKKT